ncbi:MAG: hypothetical protein LBU80_05420 [Rikenellaceae bacterium]|jgi:hypothetical protein|nr:hypothetical protein [Rikenellaceae bacterium]
MKFLLSAVLLFCGAAVFGQEKHDPGYLPYSQFAPDTAAYLKRMSATDPLTHEPSFYYNCPAGYVLDDLEIEPRCVWVNFIRNRNEIGSIYLVFESFERTKKIRSQRGLPPTIILNPISKITPESDKTLFDGLAVGHTASFLRPWSDELARLLKDVQLDFVVYLQRDVPKQ